MDSCGTHSGGLKADPWEGLREGPIDALDGRSVNVTEAGDQKQDWGEMSRGSPLDCVQQPGGRGLDPASQVKTPVAGE